MSVRTLLDDRIGMKHGSGGRAMRALIEQVCLAGLGRPAVEGVGLAAMDDGAAIRIGDRWLVVTTDSHVVHPLVFPGGDIGRLAVCGTVNDLAMMGATEPLALTCALIVEEGFARADLERVYASIKAACDEAGAPIVTGDTKVMGRGELDGLVLNTTGVALCDRVVSDAGLAPGDVIILTGTIGDHGMAIMAARHHLALQGDLRSDVAPLNGLVRAALAAGGTGVVAMKDQVRAASDLLGIDPLAVANEGKALIGVRETHAEAVLAAVRRHPLGADAAIVGRCLAQHAGAVILDTGLGRRMLAEPDGELLPRIC